MEKIDRSEYDGDLGWVNIDEDQDEWRLELDINGYKVFGVVDRGGTDQMQASIDRVQKLFHQLPSTSVIRDVNRGTLDGWFDCDNIPDITITMGGREFNFRIDSRRKRSLAMTRNANSPVYGEEEWDMWDSAVLIFRLTSFIVFDMGQLVRQLCISRTGVG